MEHPEWRRSPIATSEMMDCIAKNCGNLKPLRQCQFLVEDFVFHVNFLNFEGCDTIEETRHCLAGIMKGGTKRAKELWEECSSRNSISNLLLMRQDEKVKATTNLFHAYSIVLHHWSKEEAFPVLRTSYIKRLHFMLFCDRVSVAGGDSAGVYRQKPVYVQMPDCTHHTFLAPERIDYAVQELLGQTNTLLEDIFSSHEDWKTRVRRLLYVAGDFFLKFERIHPFIDGNGRVGRLLLAYLVSPLTPFGPYNLYLLDSLRSIGGHATADMADHELNLSCFRQGNVSTTDPSKIIALLTEGIYVGWKLSLDQESDSL